MNAAREARDAYLASSVRRLPEMLESARRKVEALENEARRYGFDDLVRR